MTRSTLIVALDVENLNAAKAVVSSLGEDVDFYKVGLRLFTESGPETIRWLKSEGKRVFLDLKFYDIPNTVAGAIASSCALGVDLLTVHASGGLEMMSSALQASQKFSTAHPNQTIPQIFAVTVLTSFADLSPLGIQEPIDQQVLRLAALSQEAKIAGVVCSPLEIEAVRAATKNGLKILTPGIRLPDSAKDDQKRTLTPDEAQRVGADYLVVGRPILNAENPKAAVQQILNLLKK